MVILLEHKEEGWNFVTYEINVRRVWRKRLENLHNNGSNEEVRVNVLEFGGVRKINMFGLS